MDTIDGMSSEAFSDVEVLSTENNSLGKVLEGHPSQEQHPAQGVLEYPNLAKADQWNRGILEQGLSPDLAQAALKVCKQRNSKSNNKKDRPLCLDYLNGTCHRLRSSCSTWGFLPDGHPWACLTLFS